MKSVSASIIVLAGSILLAAAGMVHGDSAWLLGPVGLGLVLLGLVAWYWSLASQN